MKKSILSLFIIAAILMVPILSFEASALTAYGQPCTANADCTSGKCRIEIDTFKSCGCSMDSDCSDSRKCNTANNFCMNKKVTGAGCVANSQCYSGSCTSGRCAAGGPTIDANKVSGIVCETGFPGWLDHLDAFGQMIKVSKYSRTGDLLTEVDASRVLPPADIYIYSLNRESIVLWGTPVNVADGDRETGTSVKAKVTSIFENPVSRNNWCADVTATKKTFTAAPRVVAELSLLPSATREATPVETPTGGSSSGPTLVGTACTSNADCPSGQTCQACPSGATCTSTRLCLTAPAVVRCSTNAECGTGKICVATSWTHSPTGLKDNGAECDSYRECKSGTCVARSGAKGTCTECQAEGVQRCGFTGATCTAGICKANSNARCYDNVNCKSGFCSRFPKDTNAGICSTRCRSDSDCSAGNKCNINSGVCERGECQASGSGSWVEATRCSTNTECGAGKECVGRTWVPTQRQMKINGAECANGQECATGVCIPTSGGPGHCASCTAEGIARCPASDRCGSLGICQSGNNIACNSPLRCQSGFCSRAYGNENGICLPQSSKCTSDAGCPAGNKCNVIAGICEVRGECRTIAAPAGGDSGTCSTLAGAGRISCEINALIANMRTRVGRL